MRSGRERGRSSGRRHACAGAGSAGLPGARRATALPKRCPTLLQWSNRDVCPKQPNPNRIWLHAPQLRGENVIATARAFSAELAAQARPGGRLRPHDAEGSVYVDIFSSVMVRSGGLLPWRQGSAASPVPARHAGQRAHPDGCLAATSHQASRTPVAHCSPVQRDTRLGAAPWCCVRVGSSHCGPLAIWVGT